MCVYMLIMFAFLYFVLCSKRYVYTNMGNVLFKHNIIIIVIQTILSLLFYLSPDSLTLFQSL